MSPKFRQLIILSHVVLAGFFLPMALTFSITGGLYTFGITGKYDTVKAEVPLSLASEPKLSEVIEATETYLNSQNVSDRPTGSPKIKKVGTSWQFEWTGSNFDFTLEPTDDPAIFNTAIKRTGIHRFFVQLHKAKGGFPFKVLAGGLAIAFILLFASGIVMAFSSPRLKRSLYISSVLGILTFIVLAYLS